MKFECVLCKYKNNKKACDKAIFSSNWHCPTLQNIYYGKVIEYQPFKAIQNIIDKFTYRKEKMYYRSFNNDCTENEDIRYIFGVISYDDLTSNRPNLLTMNDLDVIYDKHNRTYSWNVEYIYSFPNKEGKKKYLKRLLKCFTKFMKEHNYNTELDGFHAMFSNVTAFDTLEECYANFKYCVNGYIHS